MTPIAGVQHQERNGRVVTFVNPLYWFALAIDFHMARDAMSPLLRILAETVGRQQGWLCRCGHLRWDHMETEPPPECYGAKAYGPKGTEPECPCKGFEP